MDIILDISLTVIQREDICHYANSNNRSENNLRIPLLTRHFHDQKHNCGILRI